MISKPNDRTETRLGITVSGKVGNSVVRNRIKRQVREFFRRQRAELAPGRDLLVIARSGAAQLPAEAIRAELERVMEPRQPNKA